MKSTHQIATAFAAVCYDDVTEVVPETVLRDPDVVKDVLGKTIQSALEDPLREVVRQVTLEKKLAQAYRRRVKQFSPHRTDIQREQDAAVRHLNDVITRLGKLQ
jgi:hypothetical protein